MRPWLTTALLGLLLALPAAAQEGAPPAKDDPDKALAKRLESELVTVSFDQTPLREVAAFISKRTGVSVVLAPGVDPEASVTLKLADVSLKNTLKLLATAVDGLQPRPWCGVLWLGRRGQRLPAPPPIPPEGPLARSCTLHFDETPLEEVLAFLGDISGRKVTLDPAAQAELGAAKVSLRVKALPFVRVLALLQAMHGLVARVEEEAITLQLAPEEGGAEQPEQGAPGGR